MSGGPELTKQNKAEEQLLRREEQLLARKETLDALEQQLREKEKELKARDAKRKQIILRLPESLWRDIARWADEDFRSINSQIEYILTKNVREKYRKEGNSNK